MNVPAWSELDAVWREDEGALRDLVVAETSIADWRRVVDSIRAGSWRTEYSEDGDAAVMPSDVRQIFAATRTRACLWSIYLDHAIRTHCHFFDESEIEFDIDPREIRSQESFESLCVFMRAVGRSLEKPVSVYVESYELRPVWDMQYDPASDTIVRSRG